MADDFYTRGEYLARHPDWHAADSGWKAAHIMKMLSKNNLHPKSVVEIGCGSGEILRKLQEQLPSDVIFDGYEISPQAYELSKQRENERLKFHLGNVSIIPEQHYDLSLMIDVFEHVEDFYGFLKEARHKARHAVFHIPLDLSVQTVLRGNPLMRKRKNSGHIHYFTKETALAALTDSGYEIKDWFYTGSYVDRPAKTRKARLGKIPRRLLYALNRDLSVRLLGGYSLMVLAK